MKSQASHIRSFERQHLREYVVRRELRGTNCWRTSRALKQTNEEAMKRKWLWLTVIFFLPLTAGAQTAEEIVSRGLAARGGIEKIKAVHSERITGTISFGTEGEGPFLVQLKRPGKMHVEFTIQGRTLVRVYDGKSAGWIINPFAENKGVQAMTEKDLENISDESDFDGPLVDYKAKGSQIELQGKEDVEGKPAYHLKLTTKNGEVRSYFLDAGSYLLVKWEGTRKSGDKEVPWESFFHDYREVNGLKFAFEIDSEAVGMDLKQKIIAEKIEVNPPLDDALFDTPPEPAASSPTTP
jgi:hypothetical protein